MAEVTSELKKLAGIAADLELSDTLRIKSVELIGGIGTHDALLVLLGLVANKELTKEERIIALKQAEDIIKTDH